MGWVPPGYISSSGCVRLKTIATYSACLCVSILSPKQHNTGNPLFRVNTFNIMGWGGAGRGGVGWGGVGWRLFSRFLDHRIQNWPNMIVCSSIYNLS